MTLCAMDKMNYIKCIWRVGYVLKRFYGFG